MPKVKLTARNVLTLPPGPAGARATYRDAAVSGLELRVSASGSRSYRVRYGAEGAKAVTLKGDARVLALSDAHDKARAILGRVANGEDPAGELAAARRTRATDADTFEGLAGRLLRDADLADTTRRSWTWTLSRRVFPLLGDRSPVEITRPEVREAVARITERHGTSQGSEALKVARWVLARAVDADIIPVNPAAGIRKPGKERPRDRILTVAEMRTVWNAAGEAGIYGLAVRAAILTGARRGEVFGATWPEIDREARVWRLPAARTKSRRPHEVPLTRDVLELLDALPGPDAGARVFPVAPSSKCWGALLRAAGLVSDEGDGKGEARTRADRWPIRFHDLRRTFRNALTAELGIMPHVAEALVGHAESSLVRTYAPSGVPLADRRAALEKWGRRVLALAEGAEPGKVVDIRGRA